MLFAMPSEIPAEIRDAVATWLRERRDDLVWFLEQLVLAESPSSDPEAQQLVFALIARPLKRLGWRTVQARGSVAGGWLLARPPGRRRATQLLLGHTDTVWAHGTLRTHPLAIDGDRVRGPGTYDMKAGLAQAVFALRALGDLGLPPSLDPVVFLNSDEELGSITSTRHIQRLAQVVRRAFVLEPSFGPEGALKTARKGVGKYELTVEGRASHAGLEPERGVSAIRALAEVIGQVYAAADGDDGVTVNVGWVEGGTRPNVVAAQARAVVDVRAPDPASAQRIDAALRAIRPGLPGARLFVHGGFTRPPMVRAPVHAALYERARSLAADLGFPLPEATAGGGSDGNTTSRFVPTLDGLGAVGDGAHAAHEHVRLDALVERATLLALLLLLPEAPLAPWDSRPPLS